MTTIHITTNDNEEFTMKEYIEQLEVYPWIVLNFNEIGASVAFSQLDAEYMITREVLDEEINDYLSNVHERILEKAIDELEENGIEVY